MLINSLKYILAQFTETENRTVTEITKKTETVSLSYIQNSTSVIMQT